MVSRDVWGAEFIGFHVRIVRTVMFARTIQISMRSLMLVTAGITGCWDNILIHLCSCVSYAIK